MFKFTALRPVNWPAAACKCFPIGLQSVASKLPGCHSGDRGSHWHAAARTRTSKWRPGPATSWPARAVAQLVPRRTSDTSRQVTRLMREAQRAHTDQCSPNQRKMQYQRVDAGSAVVLSAEVVHIFSNCLNAYIRVYTSIYSNEI